MTPCLSPATAFPETHSGDYAGAIGAYKVSWICMDYVPMKPEKP
jgi:hypothetical protein